jgi:hypothetical protein
VSLPRLSWDEAEARHVWPAAAFREVGIKPATVRKRASRGELRPVALGPRGCKLYRFIDVVGHAEDAPLGEDTSAMSH